MSEHLDVVIVGAGLSGIAGAYHLQRRCPDKRFAILEYVRETAAQDGIDRHIRFNHRVVRASWCSEDARWTVEAQRTDTGEAVTLTCSWLFCASGYYNYDQGFTPEFPGL